MTDRFLTPSCSWPACLISKWDVINRDEGKRSKNPNGFFFNVLSETFFNPPWWWLVQKTFRWRIQMLMKVNENGPKLMGPTYGFSLVDYQWFLLLNFFWYNVEFKIYDYSWVPIISKYRLFWTYRLNIFESSLLTVL